MQVSKIGKNIKFSLINYIVVNALKFIVRMVFVQTLPIEYLGVNGLFSNILAMLTLAELGVGPAIVYSLYKPLAIGDKKTIKSIMKLFKRVYITVGIVILFAGLCVYPWLESFIKDKPDIPQLQYFYLVFLLNTAVSYFWSYQRNLLIADQKQYVVNMYQACAQILVALLQIISLWTLPSYWCFIGFMLLGTILENVTISQKANNEYPYLIESAETIAASVKESIIKNTKAMMAHKIGGIVVLSTSNIILSKYVGLVAVGIYSNYYMVIAAMNAFASKFFEAITASIGNMLLTDSEEEKIRSFAIIEFVTAFQASLISVGMYVLFNPLIELWLGPRYLFDKVTVLCIVTSFYLMYMRKAVLMYKDASGLFWNDRYKPLAEAAINLVASMYLVQEYGVVGVICGGIISTLTTCFWVEPYVLFKHGLNISFREYYTNYFKYTILTAVSAYGIDRLYSLHSAECSAGGFVIWMLVIGLCTITVWGIVFYGKDEMRVIRRIICSRVVKK